MTIRHRKTRRRLRSKRAHSRKGSRRQRGGRQTTLGDLVAVLHEDDIPHDIIPGMLDHVYPDRNAYILDNGEINEALIIPDDLLKRVILQYFPAEDFGNLNDEESDEFDVILNRIKAISEKRLAKEIAEERGRNITALQYVAKAPQNGSRAANVLLHPQLSGLIGEQLSGKKGSLLSQVNKLKQNAEIPGAPRP